MALPHNAWTSSEGGTGTVPFYLYRSGFKQTPPIDKTVVLPYNVRRAVVQWYASTYRTSANGQPAALADPDQIDTLFPRYVTATKNKCYDKFLDAISDRASMGETLAEMGSTVELIHKRVTQIHRFARLVKQRKLEDAWRELTGDAVLKPKLPKKYARAKSFSGAFLEAHLAWEPLIRDIYAAIDVLQSPIAAVSVKATASCLFEGHLAPPLHTWAPSATYPSDFFARGYTKCKGKIRVKMGARVAVNNPNLWLANQLGLTNPVQVLWAVTPFTMVVDWFVNVSQVLNSMTDFLGLSVSGGYTTTTSRGEYEKYLRKHYQWYESGKLVQGGGLFEHSVASFSGMNRDLGIALPSLILQPYKVPSLPRAATAVSLLVQFLPRK